MLQGQITGTHDALATKDSTVEGTLSHSHSSGLSLHLPAEITDLFCQMMSEVWTMKWTEGLETKTKQKTVNFLPFPFITPWGLSLA